jgi:HTH-type transcriptional regulator, competence development regulator
MKLEYPKEWFERSALIEGDAEVGAGVPPTPKTTEPHTQDNTTALDTRIALGQFVALWRRNQGWNAEKLAAEAGIDISEVLGIEHDPYCEPEPDAIFKLAGVFRVPPLKLMEIAGLVVTRTPSLREQAVRFAARSETIAALTDTEKQELATFVAALRCETSAPK